MEQDDLDDDDFGDAESDEEMEGQDPWVQTTAEQARYPENMRDVRGDAEDALCKKFELREAYDKENPEEEKAALTKVHKKSMKDKAKRERKAASKTS